MSPIIISLVGSVGWAIKDAIKAKSPEVVVKNWIKYVTCIVAGLGYGYLGALKFFQDLAILGVVALVGNSFNDVWTFLVWVYSQFKKKQ